VATDEGKQVEYAAYIGLDWGDEEHAVCLQAAGCNEIERHTLKQKPEDLHDWLVKLQQRFGGQKVAVAIEQSKGAVIYALLVYDFMHVFRINPKSLARYREASLRAGLRMIQAMRNTCWHGYGCTGTR